MARKRLQQRRSTSTMVTSRRSSWSRDSRDANPGSITSPTASTYSTHHFNVSLRGTQRSRKKIRTGAETREGDVSAVMATSQVQQQNLQLGVAVTTEGTASSESSSAASPPSDTAPPAPHQRGRTHNTEQQTD